MRDSFKDIEGLDDDKLFSNKLKSIEYVQINFNDDIKTRVFAIKKNLDQILKDQDLDGDTLGFIDDDLVSNLKELELNIGTIIVNCQRVTGLKIKLSKHDEYKERRSFFKKGQLLFLLDRNTSQVYGKTLLYLQEELRKIIIELAGDIGAMELMEADQFPDQVRYLEGEYFKINSDMYTIIDGINLAIDSIYDNISGNKNKNINLSFLLVSAFLSVVLFFPEFNNMLNLKNNELTLDQKIDEIIYEKVIGRTDLSELIDIKKNIEGYSLDVEYKDLSLNEDTEEEIIKKIIAKNINNENERLEIEKNRINIFLRILFVILLPFLIWIIFISI